ncbi:MAG: hypothetical protein OEW42_09330 [Acidimicrobiia bacterium]|nr:hypothetical protein [Acidimicrobiia bacterium]MDH5238360.1 hypothetical protein [Acidimicrobiia bacterium]
MPRAERPGPGPDAPTLGVIDGPPTDTDEDADDQFDPERLAECGYWRCGELFEQRSVNHRYCAKACRSRQKKWERAQQRRARRRG